MSKKVSKKLLDEAGKVLVVQNKQADTITNSLDKIYKEQDFLSTLNKSNNTELDDLLENANSLLKNSSVKMRVDKDNIDAVNELLLKDKKINDTERIYDSKLSSPLETITVSEDWEDYLNNVFAYADKYKIDLSKDPFDELLSKSEKAALNKMIKEDYTMKKANCDKYDYMIASFCGVVSGLIDVFFVGIPHDSKLGKWSDNMTDNFVIKVAKKTGYEPKDGKGGIANAIAFLEKKFPVNYDQATSESVGNLLGMSATNHHIKSLGHSPSIIGLIFSILDQFSSTSHFLDNGRLIVIDTQKQELRGSNFISRLFCGFSNWLGHLISDVSGSSSSRRKGPNNRGAGIPMPLFELFQLFGGKELYKVYERNDKSNNFNKVSFADLSVKVFEQGYDARFAVAQTIPVLFNEISIRLLWSIKSKFYHKRSFVDSLPFGSKPELRVMLLTGHGVLCFVDGADALLRSGGQPLLFILRMNFVAWKRLAFSGLIEVRAKYKESAIDLNALENDLKKEWNTLYNDNIQIV